MFYLNLILIGTTFLCSSIMMTDAKINRQKPVKITKVPPVKTLPTLIPSPPKLEMKTTTPQILQPQEVDKLDENNIPAPVDDEAEAEAEANADSDSDDFEKISIGSDDEYEAKPPSKPPDPVVTKTRTKSKSKTKTVENLLNNPTVKTLIKAGTVTSSGLIGTIVTLFFLFKMFKSL